MISTKENMMELINLVSPTAINPQEHIGEDMLDVYYNAAEELIQLALTIPADVYCLDHVRAVMKANDSYKWAADAGYTAEEAEQMYMKHFFGKGKAYGTEENYKFRCVADLRETLVYICPDCEEYQRDMTLDEIAKDVLFIAQNTETDNAIWMALEAGVPVDDILA